MCIRDRQKTIWTSIHLSGLADCSAKLDFEIVNADFLSIIHDLSCTRCFGIAFRVYDLPPVQHNVYFLMYVAEEYVWNIACLCMYEPRL